MYLLGIDPSIRACGWAIVDYDFDYFASGVINTPRKVDDWIDRLDHVVDRLSEELHQRVPDGFSNVIIEMPESYATSKGSAANNSQAIVKLAGVCFAIRQRLADIHITDEAYIWLVQPKEWKGQVPKEIMQKRMNHKYQVTIKDHNESDALGLCDYYERKIATAEADAND